MEPTRYVPTYSSFAIKARNNCFLYFATSGLVQDQPWTTTELERSRS